MKNPFSIVAGASGIVLFAGAMLGLAPYMALKDLPPPEGLKPYTEIEQQGRDIYVSLGCVYCHSQQPRDPAQAPDESRGWGRVSDPSDYYYDIPHQLGTMRTGPDLFNIGARQPSKDWHLIHLYQPRAVVPWSIMSPYPFLFVHKEAAEEGDVVVPVSGEYAPKTGVIVASADAIALVAYLTSLDHSYPIPTVEQEPKE